MATIKYICGNCKAEITDSSKFCTGCGKELKSIGDAVKPEDLGMVVAAVAKLLKTFGYEAASKDVTTENYQKYAQWVLSHLKNRIWLIDPVTRKKTKNVKAEKDYNTFVASFKKLGITDSIFPVNDADDISEFPEDIHKALEFMKQYGGFDRYMDIAETKYKNKNFLKILNKAVISGNEKKGYSCS